MNPEDKSAAAPSLLPVEVCVGSCWQEPSDLYYGRFLTVPRMGESVILPHIPERVFRVADVRHCPATPAGGTSHIRILLKAA